jgi:ParB family chromosome partitioning protein
MSKRPSGLGRGISALLGEEEASATAAGRRQAAPMPIEFLQANRQQPRERFDAAQISELVASIREQGILQPILVRPINAGRFEIVAGERRWRAAQKAGLHEVPVVVREFSDEEALQIAIIENVQRQDLSSIEEARAYKRLAEDWGHTQEQVAKLVGKSRPHVANLMRLLGLPAKVQTMIDLGRLSMGHARALIGNPAAEELARQIVARGLNVRQAEALARRSPQAARQKGKRKQKDADTRALEKRLSTGLGLQVDIDHKSEKKGGEVTIRYKTLAQLDHLISKLEDRK